MSTSTAATASRIDELQQGAGPSQGLLQPQPAAASPRGTDQVLLGEGSTDSHHRALRFLTAGSVDDGKSTLIGRLLFDSRTILAD
ncbi:MAG: hypothetical protein O9341_15420, partial [Paucibacter sp.]|nr:hypothetical protein [Roseateles sp.]